MRNGKIVLLIINPGSTSTKVSIFEDEESVFERSLFHDANVLLQFPDLAPADFRPWIDVDEAAREGRAQQKGRKTFEQVGSGSGHGKILLGLCG